MLINSQVYLAYILGTGANRGLHQMLVLYATGVKISIVVKIYK
jgi:hypothetical protein